MALPRSVELQWQKEVIERWLTTGGITPDVRPGLLEMLRVLSDELDDLETERQNHFWD
jgi:hypothetical protein